MRNHLKKKNSFKKTKRKVLNTLFTGCTTPSQLSWAEHRAMKECGESRSSTTKNKDFFYAWQLPSCFSLHICRVERL